MSALKKFMGYIKGYDFNDGSEWDTKNDTNALADQAVIEFAALEKVAEAAKRLAGFSDPRNINGVCVQCQCKRTAHADWCNYQIAADDFDNAYAELEATK